MCQLVVEFFISVYLSEKHDHNCFALFNPNHDGGIHQGGEVHSVQGNRSGLEDHHQTYIQHLMLISHVVSFESFGCFDPTSGSYDGTNTETSSSMHASQCVEFCFSKDFFLAALGGDDAR